jgi:hypothetical protein
MSLDVLENKLATFTIKGTFYKLENQERKAM